MIVQLTNPDFSWRLDAIRIQSKPIEHRAKFLHSLDHYCVMEGLRQGMSRPEAYARADSYMAAVRSRIEFLDQAQGLPCARVHSLSKRRKSA